VAADAYLSFRVNRTHSLALFAVIAPGFGSKPALAVTHLVFARKFGRDKAAAFHLALVDMNAIIEEVSGRSMTPLQLLWCMQQT